MNCLIVDFKIDGIEKVAGEFSDGLLEHLFEDPENKILVDQTYRARTFLKFFGLLIFPISIILFFKNKGFTVQDKYSKSITIIK